MSAAVREASGREVDADEALELALVPRVRPCAVPALGGTGSMAGAAGRRLASAGACGRDAEQEQQAAAVCEVRRRKEEEGRWLCAGRNVQGMGYAPAGRQRGVCVRVRGRKEARRGPGGSVPGVRCGGVSWKCRGSRAGGVGARRGAGWRGLQRLSV
jgi:hypothetical protein